jgi:DNA topoisomerase-1
MQNLVIVESPTKARTLAKYLGKNYVIEASMGHIRDLPKAEIGVDVDKNFSPRYIVPRDKQKTVNNLKKIAAGAKTLWLATDPDREGEAIAWHIAQLLTEKVKAGQEVKRVVFHEITPGAIKEAFTQPRDLDLKLVDAQQARRVLDRLVGYKLSPLLWKKVKSGLSAGRVQSVALRLIVEREREIEAFKAIEYWTIDALLEANKEAKITASLVEYNGKKVEIGNQLEAQFHVSALQKAEYQVSKITKKEVKKYPSPPFTTSTLQQTASNKLGFSAKKIMSVAQFLYEHGLITYMRTDSVNLSTVAISQARDFIQAEFGKEYLPESGRAYKTKSKVAQEAHEAIRPTNMTVKAEQLKTMNGITRDHIRLYDLIWKRMLACQMSEAVLDQTSIDVTADKYLLRASGSVVKFDGWMKLYEKSQESKIKNQEEEGDENQSLEEQDKLLPELKEGQDLSLLKIDPLQHFTEPPARFNDASLIKKLEELGIGRPSTYAPILSTIQERFYVERFEKRLKPTPLGMAVNDFLVKNFSEIVDFRFTANVEDELDEIARGERQWQPTIKEFYIPFAKKLEETGETAERVQIESETVDRNCPTCGKSLQVKYGRFGKFLACTGFPDCKFTDSFEAKLDIPCPQCGGEVVLRKTKKGRPFYGCKNYPTCTFASWNRPEVKAATPS